MYFQLSFYRIETNIFKGFHPFHHVRIHSSVRSLIFHKGLLRSSSQLQVVCTQGHAMWFKLPYGHCENPRSAKRTGHDVDIFSTRTAHMGIGSERYISCKYRIMELQPLRHLVDVSENLMNWSDSFVTLRKCNNEATWGIKDKG